MEIISEFLIRQFITRQIIDPDKKEIYKTGLKLILADIINFSLVLIIGALTKSFIYSCIYLIMLISIRRFSSGFHARSYWLCRLVTVGTYVIVWLISTKVNCYLILCTITCDLVAIITMFLFAPIRHPNKQLTENEVKANKFFSIVTTLFFAVASVVLTAISRKEGIVIALILLAISVLMYIGLYTNGKEVRQNVQ